MAQVIDALDMIERRKTLPTEAFFVDTNAVIDFADPFGKGIGNKGDVSAKTQDVIHRLKSAGYTARSSVVVALEYYKHLQFGFFRTHAPGSPFSTMEFKKQRRENPAFAEGWNLQMTKFRRIFEKNFPVYHHAHSADLQTTFDGSSVDFGDHAIHDSAVIASPEFPCIFTRDRDFLTFSGRVILLAVDNGLINEARRQGKLYSWK